MPILGHLGRSCLACVLLFLAQQQLRESSLAVQNGIQTACFNNGVLCRMAEVTMGNGFAVDSLVTPAKFEG
jgi:hypothetical protein